MCRILRDGDIVDCKPLPWGSNDVLLLSLMLDGGHTRAVYKPRRGETPLYDFPSGTLYRREYAAYLISQTLEWSFIPPTVIRDGPFGVGMVQWFITTRPMTDYAVLLERHFPEFQRVAAFDWLTNNADRKAGHCLEGLDGRLWLIDHGLTFNAEPKLRTVVWDFSGQPVPKEILADLERLHCHLHDDATLPEALRHLLLPIEIEALEDRLKLILNHPVFPDSFGSYRRRPWPPF